MSTESLAEFQEEKKKNTKPRVCQEALDDNLGYCVTVAILV